MKGEFISQMGWLEKHLFRGAVLCQEEWSPSAAKDLDKVLPEDFLVVVHR